MKKKKNYKYKNNNQRNISTSLHWNGDRGEALKCESVNIAHSYTNTMKRIEIIPQ